MWSVVHPTYSHYSNCIAFCRNQRPMYVYSHHPPSKLANKENEQKATIAPKIVPSSSEAQTVTRPLETNV